jgi:hypothetical protein
MSYLIGETVEVQGTPREVWSLGRWVEKEWVIDDPGEGRVPAWARTFAFVTEGDGVWAMTIDPQEANG